MNNSTATVKSKSRTSNYVTNRAALKALSVQVKELIDTGELEAATVNQGLVELYRQQGHTRLKTFHQWKDAGYSIKKGSKALLLWGEPREIKHPDPEAEEDEFKYFPLCYVFSENQVVERRES